MSVFLSIARLALPNLVAFAAQLVVITVDGVVAARLGGTALAAVALVLPLQMLLAQTANGAFGAAVGGMIARATGAADAAASRHIAWHATFAGLGIGLILCLSGIVCAAWLLSAMGGSGELLDEAARYATPVFVAGIGVWLVGALSGIARGQGRMWLPAGALVCAGIVHALLAPALATRLGVAGIGISSALAQLVALLTLVLGVRRARVFGSLRGFRWQSPIAWTLVRLGLPSIGTVLLANLAVVLSLRHAAGYGADVLTGFGIGARLEYVLVPLAFSIGISLVTLAGQARGAGNHATARRFAMAGVLGSGLLLGLIGTAVALMPELWLRWFDAPEPARAAAAHYLRHVGPFYLFFGFGLTAFFAAQAFGRIAPVIGGACARVALIAIGGWLATRISPEPDGLYWAIALAFTLYGLINLSAIHVVSRLAPGARHPAGQGSPAVLQSARR